MMLTKEEVARRRELGEKRAEVSHLIRAEIIRARYTVPVLAKEMGVFPSTIYVVLHGKSHNGCVLDRLRAIGVPESLLFDPCPGVPGVSRERRRQLRESRAKVRRLIEAEMAERKITAASLARKLGCSHCNVYNTLSGKGSSYQVLDALREAGVPEELLFDPRIEAPA